MANVLIAFPIFPCLLKRKPLNVKFIPMVFRKKTGIFRGIEYLWKRSKLIKHLRRNYSFDKIALLRADTFDKKIKKACSKDTIVECTDSKYFYSKERVDAINMNKDGLTLSGLYINVFKKLGYTNISPRFNADYFREKDLSDYYSLLNISKNNKTILIAPFSGMKMKVYPLDKIKRVISYYEEHNKYINILILGGGNEERFISEELEKEFSNVRSLVGKFEMEIELCFVAQSKVLLTMDSGNMYLGVFVDIPIVSVWGRNDLSLGFYPAKVPLSNAISKDLSCRPRSVFCEYPCSTDNEMECMDIDYCIVVDKINKFI